MVKEIVEVKNKIYTIRGKQVMLDRDLAHLYCVEVKYLKRQVRRNKSRFPSEFMFQITKEEFLRCQKVTSNKGRGGTRYLPYAFTEQGVAMLTTVLNSNRAIKASIKIMQAFVAMRNFLRINAEVFAKLEFVESKVIEHDSQINKIFDEIQSKDLPTKGIFYNGQVFDAHKFASDLLRSAEKTIILIDNYADEKTLTILSKKKKNVKAIIFTKNVNKQLKQDVEKFNQQYGKLTLKEFNKSHDRFLIIDEDLYHIGASLKDLGKKWFIQAESMDVPKTFVFEHAFSKINSFKDELLEQLRTN